MRAHRDGDRLYYTFDLLDDSECVVHGVSTRLGGTSRAPFHSLNLSYAVGDNAENVKTNIDRFHQTLHLDPETTITGRQVAGDCVAVVDRLDAGRILPNVDALLTREKNLTLMLRFADCVPILLCDPVRHAIGIVHAGWRGTVLRVAATAAKRMFTEFDSTPQDLIACIGPSIGPCCYFIKEDVAALVRGAFGAGTDHLFKRNGELHFDLWGATLAQLHDLGIERIEVAKRCTADHVDEFFSARSERNRTGRFGALIALR